MFSEVMCMSVQSKIDGEFSVLVDNISKIALAIERKGVHSSGELSNYASEIDSIVGSSSDDGVVSEEKKKEIILEFAKKLGYSRAEDIVSVYESISKTLALAEATFPRNSDGSGWYHDASLGLMGFVISSKVDTSFITYRYNLVGLDNSTYTSDVISVEDGLTCVVKTLPAYSDTLIGREDERTYITFLADISQVGNNLKSYSIDVFVNGNKINFSKSGEGNYNSRNVTYNVVGNYYSNIKYYMDYDSYIEDGKLYRKLKYVYSLSDDGTVLTAFMDSPEFYRDRELFAENYGLVNNDFTIPSGVRVVTTIGVNGGTLSSVRMSYDYVNSFVSKGYTYKFTPKDMSIANLQGFVGMVDAKEPIGVTLWTGEVVVFPKGTNKYNLKTKTFEPWDGTSCDNVDYL